MANNRLMVAEKSRDIGDFLVGRLLPFRKKRQVGPFTFIDHMGPSQLGDAKSLDVDQHPHIGLSTLTYLLEGSITHRDSTGADQEIRPGDVGFMTAGSGVAHTERTPDYLRHQPHTLHGYQVWVALPKEQEEMPPRFDYLTAAELPAWEDEGMQLRLVAGEGFGRRSPLPVYSPMFMVDVMAANGGRLDIQAQLSGEIALVVTIGSVSASGSEIGQGQMLISKTEDQCKAILSSGTRLLLFGGQPLPEPRYLYWNFVSSSKDRLEQAKADWREHRFPKVPGDHTYIPLPS